MALIGSSNAGELKINTNAIDFGPVSLTKTSILSGTIENSGNGVVMISGITVNSPSGAFKLMNLSNAETPPFVLQPAGSVIDTFSFSPVKLGLDTAIVTVRFTETAAPPHDTIIYLIGEGASNASVTSDLQSNFDLSVSPNPSGGRFILSVARQPGPVTIEVFGAEGQESFRKMNVDIGSSYALDLHSLPSGTYFLWIRPSNAQPFERKIVIER